MAFSPLLKKAYWSLVAVGTLYFLFLSLMLNETIQRNALYAHKLHTAWWQDLNRPEQWGFLKNQVQPFNVSTPDGEVLYAWHILPVGLYARNEEALLAEATGPATDMTRTLAFKLLAEDPESRLVINFHGNAGTVAQGWRTDTYRALASSSADKIHVLTVDYRGFGYSTGTPTEEGLIIDGISLVKWALDIAQIAPERIVLLGQSLGTAVTTAVAEHFTVESHIDFAGIVLVAAFSDIPSLLLTYSFGGIIPVLSPLKPYPPLQRYFARHIRDTWHTSARLANLVHNSKRLDLVLIHAKNDFDIFWKHSNVLFNAAANATTEEGMSDQQIDGIKHHVELGTFGWRNSWTAGTGQQGVKSIQQEILMHGGHNRVVTYAPVAKAVYKLLFMNNSLRGSTLSRSIED